MRKSKYKTEMNQKAYDILAAGGTHMTVCRELGIAEQTFYQWLGRGKYKNSATMQSLFSESIERGETAGRAWLDEKIKKAATEECEGNPSVLMRMAKRRDLVSWIMPVLKKATWQEKLEALEDLCDSKNISLDMYEQALCCIERQIGIIDKAKFEEFEKKLDAMLQEIHSIRQGN